ncbi:RRP15-like protein [Alosa pseudoharengus]|uniref:RRP15-like protein n=1 Tax=Alosa pseudoharengus TaxID=34774 RepID=UPI003F8C75E4
MATSVGKPRVSVEELKDSKDDVDVLEDGGSEGADTDEEDGGSEEGYSDEEGDEDGSGEEGSEADEEDTGASDDEEAAEGGSDEEQGEEGGEEDQADSNPNAGWADVMAKILQKDTPNSKPVILQKNKQLEKIKEKAKKEFLERREQIDKRKAWEMMSRVKPDVVKDREMERGLQRTATRGVVQLFNAVRKHQKDVEDKVKEAGGSERKKAKILATVSKRDFINVLRGTEGAAEPAKTVKEEASEATGGKPAWSVLRDDYMMGASMKDWDKESDGEPGQGQGGEGEDYNSESD